MLLHDRYYRCLKPMWHRKTFSLWKSFSFTPGEALAVLRVPRHKLVFLGGFATLHFSRARGTAVSGFSASPVSFGKRVPQEKENVFLTHTGEDVSLGQVKLRKWPRAQRLAVQSGSVHFS